MSHCRKERETLSREPRAHGFVIANLHEYLSKSLSNIFCF